MEIDRPIAIAVIIFIIILLVFFLVWPKYNEFKAYQVSLGKIQADFNGKYLYYSEITKAYNDLIENKEAVEKIDNALPEKPSISDLVYFFQKKSGENGLIPKSLFLTKFSAVKNSGDLKDISFSMNLLGTYNSLKGFVNSLEGSARLFEVESISFGSVVAQSSTTKPTSKLANTQAQAQIEPTYNFTVEIKTHSY